MAVNEPQNENLYHIQVIRTYLEYLRKNYPSLDTDYILEYSGLSKLELGDDGYWCSQEQTDRFQEIVERFTGNPNVAREAGRYGTTSTSYQIIRQYITSFIDPGQAYALLGRIGSKLSRGAKITIKRIASNKVEAIAEVYPGVHEKKYQCLNRIGLMEALAGVFTGELASVEHTECIHEGDKHCRYIITWDVPAFFKLKQLRKYLLLIGSIAIIASSFFLTLDHLMEVLLIFSLIFCVFSSYIGSKEKQELRQRIESQGKVAEQLMAESNRRYNDAELIEELGQTISSVLDIDELLNVAMQTLKKHLDYDRGMILLADAEKLHLKVAAVYGHTDQNLDHFRGLELHLDNPRSKGPFVVAFREMRPFLVNDVDEILDNLSERTRRIVTALGARSFVCVPIAYKDEPLGVLSLDNTHTARPPKQSDLSLLMGIAPQIAICINNARTFEMMQASEEKYRVLVESANSIILRIDTQGTITFTNRFAQQFYGYSDQEMLGRNILGLIVPNKDMKGSDTLPTIRKLLSGSEDNMLLESENILKNRDRVWVSWSNKAIYDKDGNLTEILCVGYDITARKKAEYEKKKLEEQLVRAQKMEAIGALVGGVAHDLNNILSGITSYPELLLMEMKEESPMRSAILTIKKSGDKAAAMVQDLLTLARRGVSILDIVDLNTIVREYFDSLEFLKLKNGHTEVNFEVDLDQSVKYILGSGVHLNKALMNLVINAAEAMVKGGTVQVSTRVRCLERPHKGYEMIPDGEYTVLSVKDTGTGISEADLKKIFEPFFSKKVMGKSGTGLGMTVVWSTVKDHKGFVDVNSEEGKGTRFDLFFPATQSIIKEKDPDRPIESYSGTEYILVVDDDKEQLEITRNILKKLGYQVDVAASGEEAVESISRKKPDLVILDMIMEPGIDGLETYKRILRICSPQKAVIVSGFSETESVREAMNLGVGSYIRKPFGLYELARTVWTELHKE